MTKNLSLRNNIFWALVANGINAAFSWLMLMALTKAADVNVVGLFALAQAVALPIHTFFTFKLRVVQSTDHLAEFSDDEYRNFRIFSGILNFLAAALITLLLYRGGTFTVILITSLGYSFVIYREFYISLLQKHERNDLISFSNLVQGLSALAFLLIGYLVTKDLRGGIVGILAARAFFTITVDRRLSAKYASWGKVTCSDSVGNREYRKRLLKLFHVGLPMGGVALLGTLFTSIPRLVLDKAVDRYSVGIYAALASLIVVMNLFVNSLGQSIAPRLARIYHENRSDFQKKIIGLLSASIIFIIGWIAVCSLFGRTLLSVIFKPEYADYNPTFIKLMVAGGILALFSIMIIAVSAQRSFKIQFGIYLVSTIVLLMTSIVLIPRYKIDGAVYSFALCNLSGLILSSVVFIRNMRQEVVGHV